MSAVASPPRRATSLEAGRLAKRRARRARMSLYFFLTVIAVLFLFPILYAIYTSLRPYSDTAEHGYVSIARSLTFDNYKAAWQGADLPHFYLNSLIITVPAILLTLLLSSFVAFAVSRFSWRFNIALLMLFTAGNLLPQQVIITPLYRLYLEIPLPQFMSDSGSLYDSYWGIIAIHVAFQMGFCAFVLSNYMKTIPMELNEAAQVDGATVWRQYWQIIMPLCRAPIAALATLLFTWIYNDFFWAGADADGRQASDHLSDRRPPGPVLHRQQPDRGGVAGAALPTLIVYFALQRHFIGGLTLGATKG